ncbi:MAG: DUF5916 domain-containing protein [Pseudomonadales bacterium]
MSGCFVLAICGISIAAFAESATLSQVVVDIGPGETLELARISEDDARVRIDGKLDEAIWARLPAYDEFVVVEPDTLAQVPYATRVRIFYTDLGLYFGVDMDQPQETLIKRLSGRDAFRAERDGIGITLDTSGEARYGYWFQMSLGDSISDGTLLPEQRFSRDWDGPWRGASVQTQTGWSAEILIPWGTVAMPRAGDERRLGIFMGRQVGHLQERWGWPALPFTQPRFMSDMQVLTVKGVDPRQQYNIYPFASVTHDKIDGETRYQVGADLFWRPSTNFQLTGTINPDFGAVESDDVVINLTATETFFPEKRLFFLEGQQIFVATPRADTQGRGVGRQGAPYTLVNTRRIGGKPLAPELAAGVSVAERERIRPVDLLGAAKATGQVGRLRYGVMAVLEDDVKFNAVSDTGADLNLQEDGSDYGIARLLWEDNSSGAYRAIGVLATATLNPRRDALTQGLDWHYLTRKGKLKVDGQAFTSDIDGERRGYGGFLDLEYTFRRGVTQRIGFEYLDRHIDLNDLGFLERKDQIRLRGAHSRITSDLGWARINQIDVRGFVQQNLDGLFTGGGVFLSDRLELNNLGTLTARASFSPGIFDDINSFGNGPYRIQERVGATIEYASNAGRPLSWSLGAGTSAEALGGRSYHAKASVRWQPNGRFNTGLFVRYQDRDGWLLHQGDDVFSTFQARQLQTTFNADFFLSAKQQFRVSLQWIGIKSREDEFFRISATPSSLIPATKPADVDPYDFSVSQLAFQVRYRWELAPLSDLFIVYTRYSDQARSLGDSEFHDLFKDAFDDPLGDLIVVKLRYRFGS